MKCCNCGVEVSKEFKAALSANRCPACNKRILDANNTSAFVPLCELIDTFQKETSITLITEDLATCIINAFNVGLKSDKNRIQGIPEEEEDPNDPDAVYKKRQMANAKSEMQRLRDEAYNDAMLGSVGIGVEDGATVGEMLVNQKKENSYNKMLSGEGKVKRSG